MADSGQERSGLCMLCRGRVLAGSRPGILGIASHSVQQGRWLRLIRLLPSLVLAKGERQNVSWQLSAVVYGTSMQAEPN